MSACMGSGDLDRAAAVIHAEGSSPCMSDSNKVDRMPELITFGTAPGETLELVFVFITVITSLAAMVILGAWWQR